MEEISTPRLPSINQGFHVGGIQAEREPPERSWTRIRTCLIDNPKDEGLQRRQETWSYQQKNRGVLKSLMKSLPNVPYRIKRETRENLKRSLAGHIERRRFKISSFNKENKNRLPKVTGDDSSTRTSNRLLGELNHGENLEEMDEKFKQRSDFKYQSPDGSPVYNIDNESRYTKLPKMSNSILQKSIDKGKSKLLNSKNVSFSLNDLPSIERRIEMRPLSESSSSSSAVSDGILESYGPSSHALTDMPHSIMDILSGNHLSNPRTLGASNKQKYKEWERTQTPKKKVKRIPESETDKLWLKKMVGDREVINLSGYESYARTKPLNDHYATVPYPPKKLPEKLGPLRKPPPPDNKNSTYSFPRNNGGLLTKSTQVGINRQPEKKIQPLTKSPLGPIITPPIGQNIASKSPMGNSPGCHYFPVFTGDGGPVRKIGGPKKKLKSFVPNANNLGPFVHDDPPETGNMDPSAKVTSPVARSHGSTVSPHLSNPSTAVSSRVNSPPNIGGKTEGYTNVISKSNSVQENY